MKIFVGIVLLVSMLAVGIRAYGEYLNFLTKVHVLEESLEFTDSRLAAIESQNLENTAQLDYLRIIENRAIEAISDNLKGRCK
jgi:hypothetical protein